MYISPQIRADGRLATHMTRRFHMAKSKSMSKSAIASTLAERVDLSKKQASLFLEELADLAYKEAKNSFTLPGLGKLVLQNRKARMGRNPQTGEPIRIPAKKVVKFKVSKACKMAVLGMAPAKKKKKTAKKKTAKKKTAKRRR
jgi:DNA-binding protein HU-beta